MKDFIINKTNNVITCLLSRDFCVKNHIFTELLNNPQDPAITPEDFAFEKELMNSFSDTYYSGDTVVITVEHSLNANAGVKIEFTFCPVEEEDIDNDEGNEEEEEKEEMKDNNHSNFINSLDEGPVKQMLSALFSNMNQEIASSEDTVEQPKVPQYCITIAFNTIGHCANFSKTINDGYISALHVHDGKYYLDIRGINQEMAKHLSLVASEYYGSIVNGEEANIIFGQNSFYETIIKEQAVEKLKMI